MVVGERGGLRELVLPVPRGPRHLRGALRQTQQKGEGEAGWCDANTAGLATVLGVSPLHN